MSCLTTIGVHIATDAGGCLCGALERPAPTAARVLPPRGQTRADRSAAERRSFRLKVGPHALAGTPWQDPGLGDADTRTAGGAWQARSGCGRTLPAGLVTGDPRKVRCPACKEAEPIPTPTPEEPAP